MKIKEIRKKLGRTQKGLAKILGTTPVTIGRWERGETKPLPIYQQKIDKLQAYIEQREGDQKHGVN